MLFYSSSAEEMQLKGSPFYKSCPSGFITAVISGQESEGGRATKPSATESVSSVGSKWLVPCPRHEEGRVP